jgi:hypothetical protein
MPGIPYHLVGLSMLYNILVMFFRLWMAMSLCLDELDRYSLKGLWFRSTFNQFLYSDCILRFIPIYTQISILLALLTILAIYRCKSLHLYLLKSTSLDAVEPLNTCQCYSIWCPLYLFNTNNVLYNRSYGTGRFLAVVYRNIHGGLVYSRLQLHLFYWSIVERPILPIFENRGTPLNRNHIYYCVNT